VFFKIVPPMAGVEVFFPLYLIIFINYIFLFFFVFRNFQDT
jgi:hypothetical protein